MTDHTIPMLYYVILTVLILLALGVLVQGLVQTWRLANPGKTFSLDVAKGIAAQILQTDVINRAAFLERGVLTSRLFKRPASGLAHALVFFGSIVLILGHAAYPLVFIGIPVEDGAFGYWFMAIGRDLAGVAVLIGLLFFMIRRLVFPPSRLLEGRARRGFVALEAFFLVIIFAGFTTEGLRLAYEGLTPGRFVGNPLAGLLGNVGSDTTLRWYRLFWWLHGLAGLVFISTIAHSPLGHMLLGPINAALARKKPGVQLRPIDFDALDSDDAPPLGASKLADFSPKARFDFLACVWCGRCNEVCPATQTGKPLKPKSVIVTAAEYLRAGKLDDEAFLDEVGFEATFNCVTCGACMEACPISIRHPEAIIEMRRHFVMERSELPEIMGHANKNLETREHPFVGTSASPDAWRQGLDVPFFEKGVTEYLLWIGCAITYEERAQSVARAMVKLLQHAKVSFGILEQARCTGDPAKQMGNEILFQEMASANVEEFSEAGITKIITMCAHCFNSFDRYYPELGGNYEVVPHAMLLDQLIAAGKLPKISGSEKITFHDPCYLARHNDVMDEPRNVVASVGSLVEMPRHKKDSFCCGAGGGNYWGGAGGERINDVRAKEALQTGADKIATACPFCLLMLTDGVKKSTDEKKVFDIAELVAEKLPNA